MMANPIAVLRSLRRHAEETDNTEALSNNISSNIDDAKSNSLAVRKIHRGPEDHAALPALRTSERLVCVLKRFSRLLIPLG